MITTLRPNGRGAVSQHARVGGSTNWGCVSEASADNDTSYIGKTSSLSGPTLALDSWEIEDPSGQRGAIASVALTLVARYVTSTLQTDLTPLLRIGSTFYVGSTSPLTGAYASYVETWATNPATGLAWAWADLTALQVGAQSELDDDGITASEIRITQAYLAVTHAKAFSPGRGSIVLTGFQPGFVKRAVAATVPMDFDCYVSLAPAPAGNITTGAAVAPVTSGWALDLEVER